MELWFSECHAPDVKHSLRVNRHLYSKKSEYQQIDIFDTGIRQGAGIGRQRHAYRAGRIYLR